MNTALTIDQVIAAQEANEADAMNARVTIAEFKARAAELDKAHSAAMVGIMKRIAARTLRAA